MGNLKLKFKEIHYDKKKPTEYYIDNKKVSEKVYNDTYNDDSLYISIDEKQDIKHISDIIPQNEIEGQLINVIENIKNNEYDDETALSILENSMTYNAILNYYNGKHDTLYEVRRNLGADLADVDEEIDDINDNFDENDSDDEEED